jgi:hypothetical protein
MFWGLPAKMPRYPRSVETETIDSSKVSGSAKAIDTKMVFFR